MKKLEKLMRKRLLWIAAVPALLASGVAIAQYPILDEVAGRVIDKYQNSSCEQLWRNKGEPKPPREQQAIQMMHEDPQIRAAFIDKVAAPIANKMFECGMIP
jgi:hypothetical protein